MKAGDVLLFTDAISHGSAKVGATLSGCKRNEAQCVGC
jgi:hypothetical protein